jgi:hypothetical protein
MTIKITLITPPDIYENNNDSILLMNLTEAEQTAVSDWLGQFETEENINIYFYQGELEMPWIFHAMAIAKYKYIDINNVTGASRLLASYILGKNNTYYATSDPDAKAVYGHINPNRVNDVIDFFERTLGAERQQS